MDDIERQPLLSDILHDWLREQNITSDVQGMRTSENATIRGFGWAIVIEGNNVTCSNRLDKEIIEAPIADPTILDTIKAKILHVESKTIDFIMEHVDDDGWYDWASKTRQPPPLGPQNRGDL